MNLKKSVTVAAATALTLGLVACGGDDDVDSETTTTAEAPGTVPGQTEYPLTEEAAENIYEAYEDVLSSADSTLEDFERFSSTGTSLNVDFEAARKEQIAEAKFLNVTEAGEPRLTKLLGSTATFTRDTTENYDPNNPTQGTCTTEVKFSSDGSIANTHWKIDGWGETENPC